MKSGSMGTTQAIIDALRAALPAAYADVLASILPAGDIDLGRFRLGDGGGGNAALAVATAERLAVLAGLPDLAGFRLLRAARLPAVPPPVPAERHPGRDEYRPRTARQEAAWNAFLTLAIRDQHQEQQAAYEQAQAFQRALASFGPDDSGGYVAYILAALAGRLPPAASVYRAAGLPVPPSSPPLDQVGAGLLASFFFGQDLGISAPFAAFRRHAYIVGRTGSGKSSLLLLLLRHVIETGRASVLLLEPHGDLSRAVAGFRETAAHPDRVLFLDARLGRADKDKPQTFVINPLDVPAARRTDRYFLDHYAQSLAAVLATVMAKEGTITDQMGHLLYLCVKALLCRPGSDLGDLLTFFDAGRNTDLRQWAANHLPDPHDAQFFAAGGQIDGTQYSSTLTALYSRTHRLLKASFRDVVCGPSSVDIWAALNSRKVVILPATADNFGPETADTVGRFAVAIAKQVAFDRATIPEKDRVPTLVVLDEFQRYVFGDVEAMLPEVRKYGFSFIMANQFLAQIPASMREAVTSCANLKIIGGNDPSHLAGIAKALHIDGDVLQGLSVGEFYFHETMGPPGGKGRTLRHRIQTPADIVDGKNAMTPAQWAAFTADQLTRYYRPLQALAGTAPTPEPAQAATQRQAPTRPKTENLARRSPAHQTAEPERATARPRRPALPIDPDIL